MVPAARIVSGHPTPRGRARQWCSCPECRWHRSKSSDRSCVAGWSNPRDRAPKDSGGGGSLAVRESRDSSVRLSRSGGCLPNRYAEFSCFAMEMSLSRVAGDVTGLVCVTVSERDGPIVSVAMRFVVSPRRARRACRRLILEDQGGIRATFRNCWPPRRHWPGRHASRPASRAGTAWAWYPTCARTGSHCAHR